MNIHTTLKNIRIEKGITQEQVADKIGLTRQAISAYESGKRQPGLDILMSLAQFYEVEIEEILYGTKKQNHNRTIKITAGIIAVLFLLLQTATFMLRTVADVKYPFDIGIVEYNRYDDLETRNELVTSAGRTDYFSQTTLSLGTMALCIMDFCLKTNYRTKHKIFALAIFFALSIINPVFWSVILDAFELLDFSRYLFGIFMYPILIFTFNITISEIINLRRKYKTRQKQ